MIPRLIGIYREQQHSPGREFDDAEILRLVAKHIEAAGHHVQLKKPEELARIDTPLPSLVFLMCERLEVLDLLTPIETKGVPLVNPLQAVLNTYRDRMVPLLTASALPIPRSRIIPTNSSDPCLPSPTCETGLFPIWVKRADVHNTQAGDVELVPSPEMLRNALAALHGRGISRAVLQQHIPGDLIKFYGIGRPLADRPNESWFQWFYHRDQDLARHPFSEQALQTLTQRAASVLSLEVYGGDAIVTSAGEIFLIDINAWPSFALFREEAAPRIAAWLLHRLEEEVLP